MTTSHEHSREIRKLAKRGMVQLGTAKTLSKIFVSISFIIAANFLTAAEIGIASLTKSLVLLATSLIESGLTEALIQREKLTREESSSAFWFITVWGLLMVGALAALAPLIESFWGIEGLAIFVIGASLQLVFIALKTVPHQILERDLQFKYVGLADVIGVFSSSVLKIVLAVMGFGAWALILGPVINELIACVLIFYYLRYIPQFSFSWKALRPLLSFGYKTMVSTFLYRFYKNVDYLIIGKYLGEGFLGIYRIGFEIVVAPALVFTMFFNKVAFSAFSRLQQSLEELRNYFMDVSRSLLLLIGPVVAFLFVAADEFLLMAFGDKYADAAIVIQILGPMALIRSLTQVFQRLLNAVGRPGLTMINSIVTVILLTSSFYYVVIEWGDTYGMVPICLAWLFSYPMLWLLSFLMARSEVGLKFGPYIRKLLPATAGFVAMGFLMWLVKRFASTAIPTVDVIVLIAAGSAFYFFYISVVLKVKLRKLLPKKSARE